MKGAISVNELVLMDSFALADPGTQKEKLDRQKYSVLVPYVFDFLFFVHIFYIVRLPWLNSPLTCSILLLNLNAGDVNKEKQRIINYKPDRLMNQWLPLFAVRIARIDGNVNYVVYSLEMPLFNGVSVFSEVKLFIEICEKVNTDVVNKICKI